MPSIFVWKSNKPVPSSTIPYYSGANWFLEENSTSISYLYCNQLELSNGMVFDAKQMPQNWVGSELLEIMQVPYQRIKEDSYGILDQVGGWMRYTTKREIPFELAVLEQEYQRIIRSATTPTLQIMDEPCLIRMTSPTYSSKKQYHSSHSHSSKNRHLLDDEFHIRFSRDQKE